MRHTLSILVENRFGELARIVGLFSARGYNIESLTVAETLESGISRVSLVTDGDDKTIEQIIKQLDKQIRVLSATDLTVSDHIEREMALIHVNVEGAMRFEVMKLADIFEAKIIDVSDDALTIEAVGERKRVDALLRLLQGYGIREITRSGTLAIGKLTLPQAERPRTCNTNVIAV